MQLTTGQKKAVRRLLKLTNTKQFALSQYSSLSPSVVSEMSNPQRERDVQPETWRKFIASLEKVTMEFKAKNPSDQARAEADRLFGDVTEEKVAPILAAGDVLQDPGTWIASNARNYIERNIDRQLARYLDRNAGAMVTIQGPVQSDRSSAVRRLADEATRRGFGADVVNFQDFAEQMRDKRWTADKAARWVLEELGIEPPKAAFSKAEFNIEAGQALLCGLEVRTQRVRRAFLIFDSFDVLARTVAEVTEEDLLARWITTLRNTMPTQPPFDRMTLVVVASPPQWSLDSVMSTTLSHGRIITTGKFNDGEVRAVFDAHDLGGEDCNAARGYALNELAGHPFLTHVLASELAYGESLATVQRVATTVEDNFERHWLTVWNLVCQLYRNRTEPEAVAAAAAARLLQEAVKLADRQGGNGIRLDELRLLKSAGILDSGDDPQMCGFYRRTIDIKAKQYPDSKEA